MAGSYYASGDQSLGNFVSEFAKINSSEAYMIYTTFDGPAENPYDRKKIVNTEHIRFFSDRHGPTKSYIIDLKTLRPYYRNL